MIKDIPVKEIMSSKLLTLHPKDKLTRAKEIFHEYDIHHIPVVVLNKIVGIISQGDILYLESVVSNSFDRFIQEKKFELNTIDEVMTVDPVCMGSESTIGEVLSTMLNRRINAIPITENDELIGLVTSQDLLYILDREINRT